MTAPKYHIHVNDADDDDGKEVVRQLAEDSKLIAIDRVITTRSGAKYKVSRIEFRSTTRNAK